jgi:hypothetical protein
MSITVEKIRHEMKTEMQSTEEKEGWRGEQKGQERKWRTGKEKEDNEI